MAAVAVSTSSSPMFSASRADPFPIPFGFKMEPGETSTGVYRPIVHMDEHLKLIRSFTGSSYVSPSEYPIQGGYHDGLFYQPVPVPKDLIPHMGLIIGKEGFYFKKITEASGVMLIWYNKREEIVEIFGGQTRYSHDGNDGIGSFEYCDDIVGGDEHEVWMDYFLDGKQLMDDAMERIYCRFSTVREYIILKEIEKESGVKFPKGFGLEDYMKLQSAMASSSSGSASLSD
jgi:hypothetical protein